MLTLLDPDNDYRCAIFPPSDERRVKVKTFVPEHLPAAAPMRQLLAPAGGGVGSNFAVGDFIFEDGPIAFGMYLDLPDADPQTQLPYKTTFHIQHYCDDVSGKPDFNGDDYPQYAAYPEFMQ